VAPHNRTLRINEPAEGDYLDLLRSSVKHWGRDHAAQYKGAVDATMDRLLEFPEMGQAVPDLFEGGFRVRIRHHWMYYTFSSREVTIYRILHERRHVDRGAFEVDDTD